MAQQNKVNNLTDGITINNLSISGSTISSNTDLTFSTDGTNALVFENATVPIFNLTSDGEMTNPYQVSFLSNSTTTENNKTGSGIPYTLYFDQSVYNIGGHFDDYTFTAPVSGVYYFSCSCVYTGLSSAMTSARLNLVTSNQIYNSFTNAYAISTTGTQGSISGNIVTQMDAADTCTFELTISGGTLTADVEGSSTFRTFISGHRIA